MALDMTTALTIKANVVGQSSITGLSNGLTKLDGSVNRTSGAFGRLRNSASGAIGALRGILPVIGVAGIAAFAKSNLDAADAMSKMSARTGVSVPALDRFRKVAELSDTSIDSLGRAFPALSANMDTAVEKAKGPAFEAFARLGITVKDLNGQLLPADAVMLQVADRFAEMADGSEKAALAGDLFGTKLGSELIPLLNSGGDAVRGMSTAMTTEFADSAAAFNDRLETIQEKFGDLGIRLAEAFLPVLEGLVDVVDKIIAKFETLPTSVQTFIAGFVGVAALALVFAPIISALTALGPLFAAAGAAVSALAPIIGGVVSALTGGGGLLAALAAVFTGPVGWAVLLVGAGAALFAFKDQIGAFLTGLPDLFGSIFTEVGVIINDAWKGLQLILTEPIQRAYEFIDQNILSPLGELFNKYVEFYKKAWGAIYDILIKPVAEAIEFIDEKVLQPLIKIAGNVLSNLDKIWQSLEDILFDPVGKAYEAIVSNVLTPIVSTVGTAVSGILQAWNALGSGLAKPIQTVVGIIKGLLNSILSFFERTVNSVIEGINRLISAANNISRKVGGPIFGLISSVSLPRFADGGVVNKPTVAMVGEGGEPEYIVPQSKAGGFVQNWMAGKRGISAIPGFADGGFVGPGAVAPTVQITTGPVIQQDGQTFVTVADLENALTTFGSNMIKSQRAYGARRYLGI
jgi:hypothetical protein